VEVTAPVTEVFHMLTNSTALREWLADSALSDPRPGGRIYLGWNDGSQMAGAFRRVDPGRGLSFTWQEPRARPTRVKLTWKEVGAVTRIRVRHSGFKATQKARARQAAWRRGLENLASVMATGEDLRLTRRPLLGIFPDDVVRNPDGSPRGLRISNVVEGLGAAAAGLAGGDVITGMAGAEIGAYADLVAALNPHRAGDEVEVSFLRGDEEHQVRMLLSGRKLGDIKTSADELAAQLAGIQDDFLRALASVLEGVTESDGWFRLAEGEWSIKEILAHLINGEGDQHSYLVEAFAGVEPYYDGDLANSHWRTRVTAGAYPDLAAMVESCRRLMAETVELIRSMPPEAERRRSTFWRFAYNFSESGEHLHEHLDQIRGLVSAARQAWGPGSGEATPTGS
jgi:uncharacterized protein YndB with AHSA1/START domain